MCERENVDVDVDVRERGVYECVWDTTVWDTTVSVWSVRAWVCVSDL